MLNRRDFLKTAAFATLGSGIAVSQVLAGESIASTIHINKQGMGGKMKMTFFPYELKLRHVFTVATYSRTTTPDVQVEIEYEGVTGYGEASMPPYLGETVESVMNFLKKVNLEQFSDPFQLEDILSYVDSLSPKDTAAKAAVDIALHDLVGKLLGAPWHKIWGLNKEKTPSTTFTIGIDTPDVVRAKTKECAGRFNILKVKLGRDNDKEMIETIRSVTDLPIAIDANQGWKDRQYALDMIHWLKEKGIVMDGRDIGTTVFPDAELKIFVTATPEIRAQRRFDELKAKGRPASYDEILKNVEERDYIDQNREVGPLRKAEDAILLDNSHMTIAEQKQWLAEQFQKATNG